MGMFDEVKCELELPTPWVEKPSFQTKDFGCWLDKYTITKEGRLLQQEFETKEPKDINYHGVFEFYDYDTPTKQWVCYKAKFTDGFCVEITETERRAD
jgi:hypothetical protein